MKLNPKGRLLLKDFLLNNHREGLAISKDEVRFDFYVLMIETFDGQITLHESELSDGGAYLLILRDFLDEETNV